MRHPLTGGGMTVALGDVELLSRLLKALPDFADPRATALATAGFYTARKPLAATINTLANALYAVFCARTGDEAHEAMRGACFDYLALGGACAAGPISRRIARTHSAAKVARLAMLPPQRSVRRLVSSHRNTSGR